VGEGCTGEYRAQANRILECMATRDRQRRMEGSECQMLVEEISGDARGSVGDEIPSCVL
jgi:hypothetical protein